MVFKRDGLLSEVVVRRLSNVHFNHSSLLVSLRGAISRHVMLYQSTKLMSTFDYLEPPILDFVSLPIYGIVFHNCIDEIKLKYIK